MFNTEFVKYLNEVEKKTEVKSKNVDNPVTATPFLYLVLKYKCIKA